MEVIPNKITITTQLHSSEEYPGSAFFIFDIDLMEVFGKKGRVPVKIYIDGHMYRSRIAKYAGYPPMMVFNKQMRNETGYGAGDTVTVTLEHDLDQRVVELPEDVANALKPFRLVRVFQRLSYTHQKEYVDWINDAKKAETRSRRIGKLIEQLQSGKAASK